MTHTLSITKAKQELPLLVEKANKKQHGFIITIKGKPAAVLLSIEQYEEYESWKETEEILADKKLMRSIKQGEKELAEGKVEDMEDVLKEWALEDVQAKNTKRSKKRT